MKSTYHSLSRQCVSGELERRERFSRLTHDNVVLLGWADKVYRGDKGFSN